MSSISKVTALGTGVLGSQIAFQSAYSGIEVSVYDIDDAAIAKARERFTELVETYEKEVPGVQGRADAALGRLRQDDLRHQLHHAAAQLDEGGHRSPEPLPRPAFRPPDLEVQHRRSDGHCRHIGGRFRGGRGVSRCHRHGTDPGTQGKSRRRTQSLLVPLLNAAAELAAGGYADPHDVDKVWCTATGAPLGPFQIYDVIGLTTPYNMLSHGDAQMRQLADWLKENVIDQGKLGVASGEGSYIYRPAA